VSDAAPLSDPHGASAAWPHDRPLTPGEAARGGAVWGVAMHAILSFFSLAIPGLGRILVVFQPAERLALVGLASAPPLARWLALIVFQGVFWALASVALLGIWRECVALARCVSLREPGRSTV